MELFIYNTGLNLMGIADEITSLIWTRRYWTPGEFKLLVPCTDKYISLFQKERLILKKGDDEAGLIEYISIKKDAQGLENIELQGRFITSWLDRRLLLSSFFGTDTPENLLRRMINENFINPLDANRKIPLLELSPAQIFGLESRSYSCKAYSPLLTACEELADSAGLGFRILADRRVKKYRFEVYIGTDRTAGQNENPPCVFAPEFDRVLEQEYTYSSENSRTTAYVGGDSKIEVLPVSGLERREIAMDVTDTSDTVQLTQRGLVELFSRKETHSFQSRINPECSLHYRRDYDVGDMVTCMNRKWGIRTDVRIAEVSECYQADGQEIEVTFGEGLPTLIEKVKRNGGI